jgi:hypothetical protein
MYYRKFSYCRSNSPRRGGPAAPAGASDRRLSGMGDGSLLHGRRRQLPGADDGGRRLLGADDGGRRLLGAVDRRLPGAGGGVWVGGQR